MSDPRVNVRPQQAPWPARLRKALGLMATYLLAPLVVGNLLGPPGSGWAAATGTMVVLASSMANGLTATKRVMPLILGSIVLGAALKPGWAWVVLIAALAFCSGLATMRGAGLAVSLATLVAVTAPVFTDLGNLALMAGYLVLGALYGWFMARRLNAPATSPAPLTDRRRALTIATVLAAATALAGAIVVITAWPRSTWLVAAVVALGIPTPGLTEKLMVQRMLGQLGACAVVAVLAALTESTWVMVAAAIVALTLYLMSLGRPLAEQVMYLSAFFILPAAATDSSVVVISERIAYNVIGLVILAGALVAIRLARTRSPGEASR